MDYFSARRTRKKLPGPWFRENELAGSRIPAFYLNI
jgi:hypothetical protein